MQVETNIVVSLATPTGTTFISSYKLTTYTQEILFARPIAESAVYTI
jgi:hypothetical protein